jgi:hypothetical protein
MSERRRHLRVLVPGAYCELLVDGTSIGLVPLEDVSDSGVFVAFPRPFIPVKTRVQLRFIEEKPPLVIDGTIAQVQQPGGARPAGYGIELVQPPNDAVERVAAVRTPVSAPAVSAVPLVVTEATACAALILGTPKGQGPAMAQSLTLFGVDTLFSADPKATLPKVGPRVRVVLAELSLLESLGSSIAQVRAAVEKARIIVAVDVLPDVDVRARLLKQGADELLLLPCDVFNVMRNMHTIARRGASRG